MIDQPLSDQTPNSSPPQSQNLPSQNQVTANSNQPGLWLQKARKMHLRRLDELENDVLTWPHFLAHEKSGTAFKSFMTLAKGLDDSPESRSGEDMAQKICRTQPFMEREDLFLFRVKHAIQHHAIALACARGRECPLTEDMYNREHCSLLDEKIELESFKIPQSNNAPNVDAPNNDAPNDDTNSESSSVRTSDLPASVLPAPQATNPTESCPDTLLKWLEEFSLANDPAALAKTL